MNIADLPRRLASKIEPEPATGCWNWTGATTVGYGRARDAGRVDMAHRVVYRLAVGAIPTGLDIDHLCRNRRCVCPDHLEAVTRGENMLRAWAVHMADLPGYGPEEAGARLGFGSKHVRKLVRRGELDKIADTGRFLRITPESVERYSLARWGSARRWERAA